MPLSFVQPAYLWLLLLLIPLWALTFADQRRTVRWRRWLSLGLRTIILVALVLALAGIQILWHSSRTTTVFVIDHSDSIAPSVRAEADRYVQAALEHMPAGDQAAMIVFGGDALIQQPPSETSQYMRTTVTPSTDQTDIDQALQLALALLPAETRKRIVLLSDGAETRGHALDAATLARAAEVPVNTVSLIAPPSVDDVALEALEVPATARKGQQLRLTAEAHSGRSTGAQLQLLQNWQPIFETTVELEAGINRIPITVPAPEPGFHTWEARIDAPRDTIAANNVQFSFSEVRGPPRVLLVAGAPGRAANLQAALEAAQLNPVVIAPADLPTSLIGMDAYDVVVLVDVPFRALPTRAAELLPIYVRELGRGLLMVGGEESYAVGGYRDTPIETALPVTMQVQGIKVHPDVALVLVIDRSGSMIGSKLDLAKEGAVQSFATLDEKDQIGIIAFDTGASWIVSLQHKPPSEVFLRQLGSISVGGGTDLRPGLEQATAALEGTRAKIKHIVLLTDGQAARNYEDVIQRMKTAGITLSTVGIEDYDPYLKGVAPATGGRFYEVHDLNDVPRLFFDESVRIARRGIVEKVFTPVITFPAPVVRDVESAPLLYGYNAVMPKATAQVILQSDTGDPILVQWQYGLGRAAAWTSDMKGQWAKDWVRWAGFGRFAGQLVTDLLPAPNIEGFTASTSIEGTALVLTLQAETAGKQGQSGLRAVGRLIKPDGTIQEIPLSEVEPGRYRSTAALPEAGVYRVQVLVEDAAGQSLGVVSTGAVVPPSAEYLQRDGNTALLNALAQRTGGRTNIAPEQVWEALSATTRRPQPMTWPLLWLAVLLWPIDIAVRRLLLPQPGITTTWFRHVHPDRSHQPAPVVSNLQRARAQVVRRAKQGQATHDTATSTAEDPSGTSSTASASSNTMPTAPAAGAQFDWRRARRGLVERPSEHPHDKHGTM